MLIEANCKACVLHSARVCVKLKTAIAAGMGVVHLIFDRIVAAEMLGSARSINEKARAGRLSYIGMAL